MIAGSKIDSLDSIVQAINDMPPAPAIDRDRPRARELARLAAGGSPRAERLSFEREFLPAVVAVLDDIKVRRCAGRAGDVIRIGQLAEGLSRDAERAHELSLGRENLDTMIARVGDVEIAIGSERHGADAFELRFLRPSATPFLDEGPVGIELADAILLGHE